MTADRDELWVDMTQFDTRVADGVWQGEATDPDAPGWFADVRTLVHRARGPAEPDELVDEPVLVDRMRRATLGETLADLPRRPGVRAVGRLVAMKAAAATTASVMTMAAAAATTGIVATVAATMVVPAIQERVMPIIGRESSPAAEAPAQSGTGAGGATAGQCGWDEDSCVPGPTGPVVEVPRDPSLAPAQPTETAEPAPAVAAAPPAEQPEPAPTPEPTTTTDASAPPATTTTDPPPTTTSAPLPEPLDEPPTVRPPTASPPDESPAPPPAPAPLEALTPGPPPEASPGPPSDAAALTALA
jgi:hypothetical protein